MVICSYRIKRFILNTCTLSLPYRSKLFLRLKNLEISKLSYRFVEDYLNILKINTASIICLVVIKKFYVVS